MANLTLKLIKRKYERKARKNEKKTEQCTSELEKLGYQKEALLERIEAVKKGVEQMNAEITGLLNSNNFLEANKGNIIKIDKIVNMLIFRNNKRVQELNESISIKNKKIIELQKKLETLSKKTEEIEQQTAEFSRKSEELTAKAQKLDKLKDMNIAIPAAMLMNFDEKALEDLEQFCYKEVPVTALERINAIGCEYTQRQSLTNPAAAIIKYAKAEREKIEQALRSSATTA